MTKSTTNPVKPMYGSKQLNAALNALTIYSETTSEKKREAILNFVSDLRKESSLYFRKVALILLKPEKDRSEEVQKKLTDERNNFREILELIDIPLSLYKDRSFLKQINVINASVKKAHDFTPFIIPSEYNPSDLTRAIKQFTQTPDAEKIYNYLHGCLSRCVKYIYQSALESSSKEGIGSDDYIPALNFELLCAANNAFSQLTEEKAKEIATFINRITDGLTDEISNLDSKREKIPEDTDSDKRKKLALNNRIYELTQQFRAWGELNCLLERNTQRYKDSPLFDGIIRIQRQLHQLEAHSKKTDSLKQEDTKRFLHEAHSLTRLYYLDTDPVLKKKLSELNEGEKAKLKTDTLKFKTDMEATLKKYEPSFSRHRSAKSIRLISKSLNTLLAIATLGAFYFIKKRYSKVTTGYGSFWHDKTRTNCYALRNQDLVSQLPIPETTPIAAAA